MFRSAAVAQEAERSQQQEGTRAGDAQGESEAEPLLGQQTQRLEVQLKQEVVQKEGEPGTPASEAWFYAQSKEQKSVLQLQAVQARAAFAQADSTPPEGISVRHRQTVKEYFMNLREGAK
jgi:predicted membrane metal-binding protein